MTGNAGSTGTVTLTSAAPAGGAVVTLTSSNPMRRRCRRSVTVAAGATTKTFAVTTIAVDGPDDRDHHGHIQRRGQDRDADGESGGPGSAGRRGHEPGNDDLRQRLDGHGDADRASSGRRSRHRAVHPQQRIGLFYLPDSVTVPAGGTTAQFQVTTAIAKARTVITASYNGVNKTATLESVYPTVTALTCAPNPVIGGNTTVCTVTMNGIMVEDISVYVSSDQPLLLPGAHGYLTVPAGAVSAAFSLPTTACP